MDPTILCECLIPEDKNTLKYSLYTLLKDDLKQRKNILKETGEMDEMDLEVQKEIDIIDKQIAQHTELYNKIDRTKTCQ